MEKIKIFCKINIDANMFLTTFEEASKLLLEKKEELEKQGWSNICLKFDKIDHWTHDGELTVFGNRLETDNEFNNRVNKINKKLENAKKKADREIEKYNKLKEKYENYNKSIERLNDKN